MIECITGPDGLPFWIPTARNVVTDELRAGRQWEPYLSVLYPLACHSLAWTIEVGAYCGEHTIELLRYGRVTAFEPQEVPFACLAVNCALRVPASQWQASLRLLYSDNTTRLARNADHPDWALDHPSRDYVPSPAGRQVRTIDEIWSVQQRVSFLKIDAQGCDFSILCGARALIARDRPIICCEFEPTLASSHGEAAEDYRRFFASRNYELRGFDGGNLLGVPNERALGPFTDALVRAGCEVSS